MVNQGLTTRYKKVIQSRGQVCGCVCLPSKKKEKHYEIFYS